MNASGLFLTLGVCLGFSQMTAAGASSACPVAAADAKVSYSAATRFLEQASWGPTPETVCQVQRLGFSAWIDQQIQTAPTAIDYPPPPTPPATRPSVRFVQDQFYANAINGQDQLRQRVLFALNQIWVVSAVKINDGSAMAYYLKMLQKNALGNFYDLMYDVTLSPAMGHYLDMVNNNKPKNGTGANENYARELLQLFTLGLEKLYPDGTRVLVGGQTVPAYSQEDVEELSLVLTGWTYAPENPPGRIHNPPNWVQPMVPYDSNHVMIDKQVMGVTIHGQRPDDELRIALKVIFGNPNVSPFICRQLIQHLVTSAPSPAYLERVVNVFNQDSQGVRGNLAAVVKAILTDPEARSGDDGVPPPAEGHLREPALFITGLLRALGANVSGDGNGLAPAGAALGQNIYYPATVFNYYAPDYVASYDRGSSGHSDVLEFNAPEFQILSPSTAMLRADFVNSLIYGSIAGVTLDEAALVKQSSSPEQMVDQLDRLLMRGTMPPGMRSEILKAMAAAATPLGQWRSAAYLVGSSWQYQVER